jgi:hypothetical protein
MRPRVTYKPIENYFSLILIPNQTVKSNTLDKISIITYKEHYVVLDDYITKKNSSRQAWIIWIIGKRLDYLPLLESRWHT